jgi:thiol-disulfide isomerase/thioredoxin
MSYLVAAVAVVAAASAVNLLVTFAVLRRLRQHGATLARLTALDDDASSTLQALVGRPVPDEAGAGPGGQRPRLLGFFSPGCPACHEQAPSFARRARLEAGHGGGALAAVCGDADEAGELVAMLGEAAVVLTAPDSDRLAAAIGVSLFPTFLVAERGAVAAAALAVRELPEAIPA